MLWKASCSFFRPTPRPARLPLTRTHAHRHHARESAAVRLGFRGSQPPLCEVEVPFQSQAEPSGASGVGLIIRGVRLSFGGARRSGPKQAGQGGERHVDHGRPLGPLRWPVR